MGIVGCWLAVVLAGGFVVAGLRGPFLKSEVDEVGGEYGPSEDCGVSHAGERKGKIVRVSREIVFGF